MKITYRLHRLEDICNPEKLPKIEIVLVDCVSQAKRPELFKKVIEDAERNTYRFEPKDSNFKCDCDMCRKPLK